MNRTNKTRLGIDALEARECPALMVPGDDRCGTPWPAPRPYYQAVSQVNVANPGVTTGIIAILNPGSVRGIIIEGG